MRSSHLLVVAALSALTVNCSGEDVAGTDSSNLVAAQLAVEPFLEIGTGKPGNGLNDINAPDGLVFDGRGSLLMTDARNHRVQVWDVRNSRRLGQFGSPEIFRGEIVNLAVGPSGKVIVTDQDTNLAYPFDPPSGDEEGDLAFTNYTYVGHDMFADEGHGKVGGITIDSQDRIYTVDAATSLVQRYDAEGNEDPSFLFTQKNSGAFLHGCEGIAIDAKRGSLYVSSEFDSVIRVFDLKDGSYENQVIGGVSDANGATADQVFQAAVEGLWIIDDYLLASDEADGGTGHVQIFNLREKTAFDTGAEEYAKRRTSGKQSGHVGFFGNLRSPDSVAAFTDEDGESYVAVADQNNFRVLVYLWSDILKAANLQH